MVLRKGNLRFQEKKRSCPRGRRRAGNKCDLASPLHLIAGIVPFTSTAVTAQRKGGLFFFFKLVLQFLREGKLRAFDGSKQLQAGKREGHFLHLTF